MVQPAVPAEIPSQLALPIKLDPAAPSTSPSSATVPAKPTGERPAEAIPAVAESAPGGNPPQPAFTPPDSARLRELEAEVARYQSLEAESRLANDARMYRARLEDSGWPPELAEVQAKTWAQNKLLEARIAQSAERDEINAKRIVVQRLAAQFGVSEDILIGYNTPEAMVSAAKRLGSDAKRFAALEAEVAALKGGTVPAQKFDNGVGGRGADYATMLKSGGKLPAASEIDLITAPYLKR